MNKVFDEVKNFIYSPELEDLNIFSKQYLNSIIKPYYSSNKEDDNYVSICIDFNKLNDINKLYTYQIGNEVIYNSLFLIRSILPNNSLCARIGGDEFVFIIQNCSPDNIDNIINKMHSILKKHEKDLLSSTVTAYGVHSSEKDNLSEMILEADLRITDIKNNFNHNSSFSKWGILEQKLTQNLFSFFKSLRLYKQNIDIDFLKKLYLHSISSASNLLEKDSLPSTSTVKQEQNYNYSFDETELKKLYAIFLTENPTLEDINGIQENTYSLLLDNLIHDPVTGHFAKDYFFEYLLNDCDGKYQAKYISTALVKLYNTIFSHNSTDIEGKKMIDSFVDFLRNELGISFVDDSFDDKFGNYFIALGAGDYILALSECKEDYNEKINNYINSQQPDLSKTENMLKLTCSETFEEISKENYSSLLNTLSNDCKEKKDDYKLEMLDKPVITHILNSIISDSTVYYSATIPKANDIKQKTKFLRLLSKVMLDISCNMNKEHNLKITPDDEKDR